MYCTNMYVFSINKISVQDLAVRPDVGSKLKRRKRKLQIQQI